MNACGQHNMAQYRFSGMSMKAGKTVVLHFSPYLAWESREWKWKICGIKWTQSPSRRGPTGFAGVWMISSKILMGWISSAITIIRTDVFLNEMPEGRLADTSTLSQVNSWIGDMRKRTAGLQWESASVRRSSLTWCRLYYWKLWRIFGTGPRSIAEGRLGW